MLWHITNKEQLNDLMIKANTLGDRIKMIYNNISIDNPNILDLLKEENIYASNIYNYFSFLHNITKNPEIKKIAGSLLDITEINKQKIYSNKNIYNKVIQLIDKSTPNDAEFIKKILIEFKRNGLHLDKNSRQTYKKLLLSLNHIEHHYNNVLRKSPVFVFTDNDSNGLDIGILSKYKKGDKGYQIELNDHIYNFFVENLDKTYLRERLQKSYFMTFKDNYKHLKDMLIARYLIANFNKFDSHIDYVNYQSMLGNYNNIKHFLDVLNNVVTSQYVKDISEICKVLNIPKIDNTYKINSWDLPFLIRKYKEFKFNIDFSEIQKLFPFVETVSKIFNLYEGLLNVKFEEEINTNVWDPTVRTIKVNMNGQVIGYIYLDLLDRKGKINDSAALTLQEPLTGSANKQIPYTCVLMSIPLDKQDNNLSITEISILIHEIAHCLNMIFGKCSYPVFCANNIQQTFVETVPQMLEIWLTQPSIIKMLANTNITDEQANNIVESNKMMRSIELKQQLLIANIDLYIHSKDFYNIIKDVEDPKPIFDKTFTCIHNRIFNNNEEPFINIYANPNNNLMLVISHFSSQYSGQYYGYLWTEALSRDLFNETWKDKSKVIQMLREGNYLHPGNIIMNIFKKKKIDVANIL